MTAFISYSHNDRAFVERLQTHLAQLKRDGKLDAWIDWDIHAGEEFDEHIRAQLDASDLFLACLSADYLESAYCYEKELDHALALHKKGKLRIVPVIFKPCEWRQTPLQTFNAVPHDGTPIGELNERSEAAFLEIAQRLRQLSDSLQTPDTPSAPRNTLEAKIIPAPNKETPAARPKARVVIFGVLFLLLLIFSAYFLWQRNSDSGGRFANDKESFLRSSRLLIRVYYPNPDIAYRISDYFKSNTTAMPERGWPPLPEFLSNFNPQVLSKEQMAASIKLKSIKDTIMLDVLPGKKDIVGVGLSFDSTFFSSFHSFTTLNGTLWLDRGTKDDHRRELLYKADNLDSLHLLLLRKMN